MMMVARQESSEHVAHVQIGARAPLSVLVPSPSLGMRLDFPYIIPELCSMREYAYYSQNYAGIIGTSLTPTVSAVYLGIFSTDCTESNMKQRYIDDPCSCFGDRGGL